jgi:hypothetical protein
MAASMRTSLACAIGILVFAAGQTPGATLHVDPNDPAAVKTIQEAIGAAWDFDIIVVHPGVYREHVNYNGSMVTVTSVDPNDPAVVERTIIDGSGTGSVVMFRNSEGPYSVLQGLTIRNGQNGIECSGADTSPLITKCRVVSNTAAGIACSLASPTVTETTIENNKSLGISASHGEISLCRICSNGSGKADDAGLGNCKGLVSGCIVSGNNGDGLRNQAGEVRNCLISANLNNGVRFQSLSCSTGCNIVNCAVVGNKANGISVAVPYYTADVTVKNAIVALNGNVAVYGLSNTWGGGSGNVSVDWTDVFGNSAGDYYATGPVTLAIGQHNISQDPLFAKRGYWDNTGVWHEGEYHLKSKLGRWDPRSATWVTDPADSPCLDRGDPASAFLDEPLPNGGRINMGAYGGTSEASKSPSGATCLEYPAMDFNHDCKVDQADLDIFLTHWLECGLDPDDACWPQGTPPAPNVQP